MATKQTALILAILVLLLSALFLSTTCANAQDETPTSVSAQNRTGDLPYSTSVGTDIEHVDVVSGNLVVTVPITRLRGRGMPYTFTLNYNALYWTPATRTPPGHPTYQFWNIEKRNYLPTAATGLGWETNQPYTTLVKGTFYCWPDPNLTYWTGYIFHDSGGGKYPLALEVGPTCDGTGDFNTANPDLAGAGIWAVLESGHFDSVYLADGTKIRYGSGAADSLGGVLSLQQDYKDANGNQKSQVEGGQDTLGRVIVTKQTGTNQIFYKVYDSNGVLRTYTVNYSNLSLSTGFHVTGPYGNIGEKSATVSAVTSIVLPNGRSYSFQYESGYGSLARIDLPTGAYVTYTWATFSDYEKTYRYVASRTAHVGGQAYTWTFNRQCTTVNHYCTTITETVTDPLGNQSVYIIPSQTGIVTQAKIYQGTATGTPLRQYDIVYQQWSAVGSQQYGPFLPTRVTTTLDNGLVSKKEFDYESYNFMWNDCTGGACGGPVPYSTTRGNVTEIREYDWGQGSPGPLVRKTDKTYLHTNGNYLARNIVNKVLTDTVYDGSSNQVAQTQYEYDSTSITGTSGAPQHDYSGYPASFTYRGNATKVKRWRNTDGVLLTTAYIYDDLGNIRSITDPLNHTTNWSYSDSWSGSSCLPPSNSLAYVTQVTNALSQRIQVVNYPCTGLVQAHKDENDIQGSRAGTTYAYDLLGRVTQKNLPDGGQTSYSYSDTPPVTVTTTTKITSSLSLVSISVGDGLGRITQTQLTSDPQGTIFVDNSYDALGRKASESNPYRSPSEQTYGTTFYQYDALGRVTQITRPDNGLVTTVYDGNTTTVTDEAGRKRRSVADGLGRLVRVWEPNSSQNFVYLTRYFYNALDNLTCVLQLATDAEPPDCNSPNANWRPRLFTYNSLSQLTQANNPESGIINYTYDNDGNLYTKQDARGVTITYGYDSLHRLTGKTYSNGDVAVSYFYDQSSYNGLTITNGIGRRTGMTDASASPTTAAWSYDAMGRAVAERRTIAGVTKKLSYGYNLDGSLATLTYPGPNADTAGRTITYSYNGAARALSAVDVADSINYATVATYAPQGAIAGVKYGVTGSFTGIVTANTYNSRLQPQLLSAAAPSQTVFSLFYDFHLGSGDNGNVWQIQNNRDTDRSVNYDYDELNRIKSAATVSTSGPDCWGQLFGHMDNGTYVSGYDPWANLKEITPSQCSAPPLNLGINANNRITNDLFSYDAAGNLTSDGANSYAYDAESRLKTAAGVTYTYDGDGKRVAKSTGKLYWTGTGSDPLTESDSSGTINEEYVFFNGRRLARADVSNNLITAVHYHFADHLGSADVITNADGSVIEQESDYYPFGGERAITSGPNNYKFTGKERDSESALDFFGARYYSASLGRFTIPDWAATPMAVPYADFNNPQSLNLYSYRGNNPLSGADTDGHCWPFCVIINTVSFKVSMFLGKHPEIGERAAAVRPTVHSKASAGYGVELPDAPVSGSATAYVQGSRGGWGVGADIGAQVQPGPRVNVNVPVVKDSQLVNPITNASIEPSGVFGGKGGKVEVEGSINNKGDVTLGGLYGEGFVAGGEFGGGFGDVFHAIGDAIISDVTDIVHKAQSTLDFTETHNPAPKNVAPERNQ